MKTETIESGDLLILADADDRELLAELYADERQGYPGADQAVREALRERCGLESVAPEWIGALTDAPILSDLVEFPDRGEPYVPEGAKVWWFPDYMIRDPWEELCRFGRVTFKLAPADDD